MNTLKAEKKERLSLEVSAELKERIRKLQVSADVASLTELFRKALALFELVHLQLSSGGRVIFEDKDGKQEALRFL